MALPLLLIPAVIVGALIAYLKMHAIHITIRAATAAAVSFVKTRDVDSAVRAAINEGASAATGDAIGDFFRQY